MSRWRIAAWVAAALFLPANYVATLVTDTVNWSAGDFLYAGVLLFGSLAAYEAAARMTRNAAYRAGVGVAIVAAFLLIWVNGAVGITDSDADGLSLGVIVVGLIGAFVSRFRPEGMALAMLVTALAQAAIGVVALLAGIVPAYNPALEILGLTGLFVALFAGSALLFREAAHGARERGAE